MISGHYDTIRPEVVERVGNSVGFWRFCRRALGSGASVPPEVTGANDGGSSAALLLEMARLLDSRSRNGHVWIILFDGEEALVEWNEDDRTYGSRHQATKWQQDGTARTITALINIDMVGGRDLKLAYDLRSRA